jgi:hypothetical protein
MKILRIAALGPRPLIPFDLEPPLFGRVYFSTDQTFRDDELRMQYDAVREWDRQHAEICSEADAGVK